MSEISESLHVKTHDAERCIDRLRQWGFSGFVFRGTHGWLTAVPYGGPEGLLPYRERMSSLATILQSPILLHGYSSDFGWGFTIWLPDGRTTEFEAVTPEVAETAADPDLQEFLKAAGHLPDTPAAPFDESVLAEVTSVDPVRSLLNPLIDETADLPEPARKFADALGLPQHAWLSPAYVTDDPEEARRRGGEAIGHPPRHSPDHANGEPPT